MAAIRLSLQPFLGSKEGPRGKCSLLHLPGACAFFIPTRTSLVAGKRTRFAASGMVGLLFCLCGSFAKALGLLVYVHISAEKCAASGECAAISYNYNHYRALGNT